ncbi:MAG: PIN domain-containing protein, partial [Flavobacteriales bacterium]
MAAVTQAPTTAPIQKISVKKKSKVKTKIYVLDTCVLLYDHSAIVNFEENRIAIPITVLEELDNFKVGNETKHYEARESIRIIDRLSKDFTLREWIPLENGRGGEMKIILGDSSNPSEADKVFGKKTNDHRILDAALNLQLIEKNATVVLVSKDINLRLKAKALNLPAEDYLTGKVKDMKFAYSGKTTIDDLEASLIRKMYVSGSTKKLSALGDARANNHFYIMKNCSSSA